MAKEYAGWSQSPISPETKSEDVYKRQIYIGNTATTFLMSNIRSIIKELKKKVVGNRYITK